MMSTETLYNQEFANKVAGLCIEKYNKLPKTGKPNVNESQWTLLSGICLEDNEKLTVVAVGTGTKCLGRTSYSKNGDVLHDSHAEVLTRRAWLRYLYLQMSLCLTGQPSCIFNPLPEETVSKYQSINRQNRTSGQDRRCTANNYIASEMGIEIEINRSKNSVQKNISKEKNNSYDIEHPLANEVQSSDQVSSSKNNPFVGINKNHNTNDSYNTDTLKIKFCLRSGIKFHFYTSHTPCGDASIFPRRIKATTLAKIQTQTQRYKIQKDFLKRRKLASSDEGRATRIPDNSGEDILCKKPRVHKSEEIDNRLRDLQSNDLASNENVKEIENLLTSNLDSSSDDSEQEDSLSGDVGSMVQDFHRTGAKILPHASQQDPKGSGTEFHVVGVPRLKPGRGDPTYSMSCSDKIAKWNTVGWEGTLISTLLESPIYMTTISVGGGIAFSMEALHRALISRVSHLMTSSPVLLHSQVIFPAGKRSVKREMKKLGRPISSAHPMGGCIIWCNVTYKPLEVAIEGIRQGVSRKIHDKNSTNSTLLVSSYKLFLQYIQLCKNPAYLNIPYSQIKSMATEYQARMNRCKEALGNWLGVPEEFTQFTVADLNEKL